MSEDKLKEILEEQIADSHLLLEEWFARVDNYQVSKKMVLEKLAKEILKHYIPISEEKNTDLKEVFRAVLISNDIMGFEEKVLEDLVENTLISHLPISEVGETKEKYLDEFIDYLNENKITVWDATWINKEMERLLKQYKTNTEEVKG